MAHEHHASFRKQHHSAHSAKLGRMGVHRAEGGRVDDAEDRKIAAGAVHKHERHLHKGEALTKLKSGGAVEGGKPKHALHRRASGGRTLPGMQAEDAAMKKDNYGLGAMKRASGGRTGSGKGKAPHHTTVNVISAPPRPPMPLVAPGPGASAPLPPRPPMAPPPGAPMPGMAPGGPPIMPHPMPPVGMGMPNQPMRAAGGRTYKRGGAVKMDAGSGGGEGRLEKIKAYGRNAGKGEDTSDTADLED